MFERAGVAISANGDAALLVGPESAVFGKDFGKLDKVFVLKEFRESADPSYPELQASTFNDVFKSIGVSGNKIKIGLGSYVECTLPIYEGLLSAYPEAEIVKCNDIMVDLRKIKSANELACIKEKPGVFIGIWLMFYLNITCGLALISQEKMIIKCIGLGAFVGILSSVTAIFNAAGRLGLSAWADKMKNRNTIYKIIFINCALSIIFW